MKIETFDLRRANEDTFDPRRTQAAAANDSVNFGRHDSPEKQQDQQQRQEQELLIQSLQSQVQMLQQQINSQPRSTQYYLRANELVRQKQFDAAYKMMLDKDKGDDLYLLRMVV